MNSNLNAKNKFNFDKKKVIFAILTGLLTGFANGMFGGGGGMIVVPMLVFVLKMAVEKAHATAILIILPLSILSLILYATFGNFSLDIGVPTSIGVTVGGVAGALLLKKLSNKWLIIIFSIVMAFAGFKLLLL